MKNKKMPLIALAVLAIVGIVGATIAYFTNSQTFENLFETDNFSTTVKEVFESPSQWVPGTVTNKTVEVTNKGNVPVVVRAKIEDNHGWYNGDTKLNIPEEVIIHTMTDGGEYDVTYTGSTRNETQKGTTNKSNWKYNATDGYYYYMEVLGSTDETKTTKNSFVNSVEFNGNATLNSQQTCTYTYTYKDTEGKTQTVENVATVPSNVTTTSVSKNCTTGADSYAGATYKLNITVETLQATRRAVTSDWGTDAITTIGSILPAV